MVDSKLRNTRFKPLPLGDIRPTGWLLRQLQLQADGLSGHLDLFWPDVADSQWFGGSADSWERAPYWLDGVIPLAYLLDDPDLIGRVTRYIECIIANQRDDGWIAPTTEDEARYDLWSHFLILKALIQYHEATADDRITDVVRRSLRNIDDHIRFAPLFNWGQARWFEALIPIQWLYAQAGESWLLELALKLKVQGTDWRSLFEDWPFSEPTPAGKWHYLGHVVNNAMAIKSGALWWRHSGDEGDRDCVYSMIDQLDRAHGMVTGVFTGDECLAGLSPVQGTELCAVVEYMYSLEHLLAVIGDPTFGDRLERIAFNALPATFTPDMWAHQYDQQVNQVQCSVNDDHCWTTNGPDSNIYGLEPNFGCCTADLSQGWPKFATHLWMAAPDNGLAVMAYAPSTVRTTVNGIAVSAWIDTEYPFRETISITVTAEEPVSFPLLLRIPEWANGASLQGACGDCSPVVGSFHRVDRTWSGTETLELKLPMSARVSRRHGGAVAIERGPLVYALSPGEEWRQINTEAPNRETPHADWEVYATTPWNYALSVSESAVENDVVFSEHAVGDLPFSPQGAPVFALVKARQLPRWTMVRGNAGMAPGSPVDSDEPEEDLRLIPYGCTNLRIAEFPILYNGPSSADEK